MSADLLERATRVAADVLSTVKADQLDDPTPCSSWKVRDLVNHMVGGTFYFTAIAETGSAPQDPDQHDHASGDFAATYASQSKEVVRAFRAEGAMEKTMHLPFGDLPGSIFVMIATTDTFVHSWDLAKATGQSTDLDPELAEQLLTGARMMISDDFRGPEPAPFGAAVDVPDDAPAADRLAGFLGRQVSRALR